MRAESAAACAEVISSSTAMVVEPVEFSAVRSFMRHTPSTISPGPMTLASVVSTKRTPAILPISPSYQSFGSQ